MTKQLPKTKPKEGASDNPQREELYRLADEHFKAGRRLMAQRGVYGGARPSAIVWLLMFAQEDLGALGHGGLSDRWEEVKRFAFDGGLDEGTIQGDKPRLGHMAGVTVQTLRDSTAALDLMKDLQALILDKLKQFSTHKQVTIRELNVSMEVIVKESSSTLRLHAPDLRTGFLYHAVYLLGDIGHRIRACRCCDRLFLAGRTDKEFCSGLCQAKYYKREHSKKTKGGKHGRQGRTGKKEK